MGLSFCPQTICAAAAAAQALFVYHTTPRAKVAVRKYLDWTATLGKPAVLPAPNTLWAAPDNRYIDRYVPHTPSRAHNIAQARVKC